MPVSRRCHCQSMAMLCSCAAQSFCKSAESLGCQTSGPNTVRFPLAGVVRNSGGLAKCQGKLSHVAHVSSELANLRASRASFVRLADVNIASNVVASF
eukprot:13496653-Alexandrium_andersonii.AAC.1